MTPQRVFKFLRQYLFRHPLYVLVYGVTFFSKRFVAGEHLFTQKEIMHKLHEGKSIIRFGDGEINLLLGLRNHYESFSKEVQNMMKVIVQSYRAESSYILSVPRFINMPNEELKRIGKFHVWLPLKVMFWLSFPKHVGYMDAHNFYYDNYFENLVQESLLDKKVIIVTKQETIDKQKKNDKLPWKEISYVATPESEAIEDYDDVQIRVNAELAKYPKKDALVLIAMGPVGKYLAFEYAKMGFQAIDLGRGVETMFTGESIAQLV